METFTSAPNLIIADYRLTGKLDGIEVITNMRQRYGDDLPAILLTGDLAPSVGKIGAGLPPLVLNKPVSIADLSDLMRSIL
jgi:CheY-like chemotaxis protein